jgi:RES domain-containing protein
MTIWYRVSQSANKQIAFSGEGGLFVAGRWNHLGKKSVYCSESIALCTLEWLAHNGLSVSGFNYYRYAIDVPDELVEKFSITNLPKEWNVTPSTDFTRDFSEKHLFSSNKILALIIPSVIVPEEKNIIINPLHSEFHRVAKTIKNHGQYIAPNR